ncbi:MAG: hypothetical protein RMZ69_13525, partial [Nostoc sp. ChiQUE01a]|nr:hypothetical protein [Nostoc sp. ChiQUE01a]
LPSSSSRPLAKVTFARGGKGKRLKGKGFLLALSPLPLTLFPTSARSLMIYPLMLLRRKVA